MQGKELWSPVEVDGPVTCLTGCESRGEVALSRSDGSVQLWDVDEWTLKATFNISGSVTKLIYASIGVHPLKKSSVISQTFLMVKFNKTLIAYVLSFVLCVIHTYIVPASMHICDYALALLVCICIIHKTSLIIHF